MKNNTINLQDLINTEVHVGAHLKNFKNNTSIFTYGIRNENCIINLEYTVVALKRVLCFILNLLTNGKKILFIANQNNVTNQIFQNLAKKHEQFYISDPWVGGMLTNMPDVVKKRQKFKNKKMQTFLSGISGLDKLPDALFILNPSHNTQAINEARILDIPVVAICNTNDNIKNITYIIPGNNLSIRAVSLYCKIIDFAITQNKKR